MKNLSTSILKCIYKDEDVVKSFSVFFLIVCIASFFIPDSYTITRLENYFLPIAFMLLLFAGNNFIDRTMFFLLFLFILINCFSSLLMDDDFFFGISYQIRFFKGVIIFMFFNQFGHYVLPYLRYVINGFLFLLITVSLLEIINPLGIGQDLSELFSTQYELIEINSSFSSYFRLLGVFKNPNDFGIVLIILFIYYFVNINKGVHKNPLPGLFSIVVLLILTQSRTGFFTLLVVLFFYLLFFRLTLKSIIIFALAITGIVFLMFILDLQYVFQGVLMNPLTNSSFVTRLEYYEIMF